MLFTVSAKASSFGCLSNIGSTKKNITVSGFDHYALINLIICKNSELMADSVSPHHEVTTKNRATTYILYYYWFLFSR